MRVLFPRSASGAWSDFLGANSCALASSQSPGSAPTLLSHHAPGSPLGLALSWALSTPGVSLRWRGTSRVRILPTDTRTMALEPPFSSLCYYSGLHLNLAMLQPGDTLSWRRLTLATFHLLATPHPGDASSWRRLLLATPNLGGASSWRRLKRSVC